MSSKRNILNFIKCIAEEKYAQADKYLKLVVVEQLKARIAKAVKTQRIF